MAPRNKFSAKDIMDAALKIVRREGIEKLTARSIADELGSSTMPIYSCGITMTEIAEQIIRTSWEILTDYQSKPSTDDIYLNMGIGYVLFAKKERNLFCCIHNNKFNSLNKKMSSANFVHNLSRLENYSPFANLHDEVRAQIMTQGWIFCHGLADLLSRDINDTFSGIETDEDLKHFFIEANRINYNGIQWMIQKNINK